MVAVDRGMQLERLREAQVIITATALFLLNYVMTDPLKKKLGDD